MYNLVIIMQKNVGTKKQVMVFSLLLLLASFLQSGSFVFLQEGNVKILDNKNKSIETGNREYYGFEDMKNCVMAEEGEILYKVTYLMEHRDKLEEITDAGYHHMQGEVFDHDFVAIAQWYNLWRQKPILCKRWRKPNRLTMFWIR